MHLFTRFCLHTGDASRMPHPATCHPPDFVIYNAGAFPANKYTNFMTSSTSIDLSIKHREMVILGTMYAGEMKKGVFT